MSDDTEIVRDQQQRHAALLHQVTDQIQNLPLNSHIEGGGGLISNQQIRLTGQCHGNRDALTLTTRKLMWVGVDAASGSGNTDPVQQRNG